MLIWNLVKLRGAFALHCDLFLFSGVVIGVEHGLDVLVSVFWPVHPCYAYGILHIQSWSLDSYLQSILFNCPKAFYNLKFF